MACTVPKRIEEITLSDLENSRWCYYHNDQDGYDCFEFAVPDSHPAFSEHIQEIELAEFNFAGKKILKGMFDGSESFTVFSNGKWYSLWYGVAKPSQSTLEEFRIFLNLNKLSLPISAKAIWSGTSRIYNGLQYIDHEGTIGEIVI